MTAYALDTNAAISLLNGTSTRLRQRLFEKASGSVVLPAIVVHELYWGAYRSGRIPYNLDKIGRLTTYLAALEFDANDARTAAMLRSTLAATGTPIGPYDTLIAGQAKARGLTVVTNNIREFSRVAGLSVEDWTL